MRAVEILMQAVVVAFEVLKDQRRRALLTGAVAAANEVGMNARIAHTDAHLLVPAIRNGGEPGIKRLSQILQELRQRIAVVFVFAAAKAVARHDDARAIQVIVRVPRRESRTLTGLEKSRQDRGAIGVE